MRRIPEGASVLTAAEMREAEQQAIATGTPADTLMERAGLAVAEQVRRLAVGRPILIAAGFGNNGGDAYAAARHLAEWGLDVIVAALAPPRTEAARRMASLWRGSTVPLCDAPPRPVLVDGLFGVGANRPLGRLVVEQFKRLSDQAALVIAIDLPSGVPADGGAAGVTLRADVTVALGALKIAHVAGPCSDACGHVVLAPIGVEARSKRATIAQPVLHRLPHDAHKFSRGMVLVIGGAMPGASLLAATAAMHGGAGYVLLAEQENSGTAPHALVRRTVPGAHALVLLLDDERIGVVVIGPGLGRDAHARALLDASLASSRNLVIDGDALSLLGRDVSHRIDTARRQVILTPHQGEFDRMFAPGGTKIERTVAAAASTGATIVHKGFDTVIAQPDGTVTIAAGMTPWLSTAGSGDVLAGLTAARLAGHHAGQQGVAEAVWLHGRAGSLSGCAFTADDMIAYIPRAMDQCRWI